ncbi:MAG: DUF2127 domain-containing protein [Patescibacteria group bacterium]|nr:DUF2127 domain-containing protein [Patescibacteria group bacterium]
MRHLEDWVPEKYIHLVFDVGVWIKGIDGFLETLGGVLLWSFGSSGNTLLGVLTQHELVGDPHDVIANAIHDALAHSSAQLDFFASLYLLSHGVVKILLVVGLLQKRMWAYPASIAFLAGFIIYQLYRLTYGYSLGLVVLTVFDVILIGLVWHEYRYIQRAERGMESAVAA